MRQRICFIGFVILALLFIEIGVSEIAAQPAKAEEFYKGAMIKFIVPYAPGGTYDLWARALAPSLEKHTGAKVIIENMAGAAGLVGGGYLYSVAKPDGLSMAVLPMPGMILGDLLEFEAAKYELDKFTYIGRMETTWRGLFASKALGTRCDPAQDIEITRKCWGSRLYPLNVSDQYYNSRAVIDACIPYERIKEFPKVAQSSPELRRKLVEKYPDLMKELLSLG